VGDPSDSDVTRWRYDGSGLLQEVLAPGGEIRRVLARDAGGRPNLLLFGDGHRESEIRIAYDLHGRIITIGQSAWLLDSGRQRLSSRRQQASLRYDLLGRLVQATGADGRAMHLERDAAGRLTGVGDGEGYRSRLVRNAEGQVLMSGLYEPGASEPLRAAHHGR